jgi:hypothetical protein
LLSKEQKDEWSESSTGRFEGNKSFIVVIQGSKKYSGLKPGTLMFLITPALRLGLLKRIASVGL